MAEVAENEKHDAARSESDKLLPVLTCPHCGSRARVEDVLFVAKHESFRGDPVLGSESMLRFRPSRYNVAGDALDPRGMACSTLACPRCHLTVPRVLLETEPLFFSLVGVPSSGKSCFLTAMTWELRRRMPRDFYLSFNDADPLSNRLLAEHEETLFLQSNLDQLVGLRKTEADGQHYDMVRMGDAMITLPRPFLFSMRPLDRHPALAQAAQHARVLALYDNAGEHFLPSESISVMSTTQHLARSRVVMFVYDPIQDMRFRERCKSVSKDAQLNTTHRAQRQETILVETAMRIRQFTGISPSKQIDRPLLILVPKADIWSKLIDEDLTSEPYSVPNPTSKRAAQVDVARIERVSAKVEALLRELTPEFIAAATENFSTVRFIPVSAFGSSPEPIIGFDGKVQGMGIRPRQINPRWVTVPLIYAFAKWSTALVSSI